jgi:hypothetical protein
MCFMAAILMVAYLNRPEVLRFIRFATSDGRPSSGMRLSPAVAGFVGAVVRLIVELVHKQ